MSLFERHPKATLLAIVCFGLVLLVTVLELLPLYEGEPAPAVVEAAQAVAPSVPDQTRTRQIRMREHQPGLARDWTPVAENMAEADSLEQRPYRFEVDDDGFIKPSKVHDDPELTIVFLGGSTTECLFVDPEVRFPYLVGRMLEERLGLRVNSYNGGLSGNNTMHNNFLLMAKVLPLNPDIVVMMENMNDIATMILLGSYWNDHAERSLVVRPSDPAPKAQPKPPPRPATVGSAFADLLRVALPNTWRTLQVGGGRFAAALGWSGAETEDRAPTTDEFAEVRGKQIEIDKAFKAEEMASSLATFASIARAWGITPVLMTQANRAKDNPDPIVMKVFKRFERQHGVTPERFIRLLRQGDEVVRDTARRLDVPLIDLRRLVPQSAEYIYDSTHFNNAGSALAAEIITAHLEPLVRASLLEENRSRSQ